MTATHEKPAHAQKTRLPRWALWCVVPLISAVVIAPIVLSSQDLIRWASSPDGLGLPLWLAWLAFVALDSAAAVCVLMITIAAYRGEGGGVFSLLVWGFAAGSAAANWRHGQTTPARDDAVFFAAMSLAGPLLLEAVLAKFRRWARIDQRKQLAARPRFGLRWLPGVAFRETLRAWKAALREGIDTVDAAVLWVRQVDALEAMDDDAALRMARMSLIRAEHPDGPIEVRDWLLARGRDIPDVTVRDIKEATCETPTTTPRPRRMRTGLSSGTTTTAATDPGRGPARVVVADPAGEDHAVSAAVELIMRARADGRPAPRDDVIKAVRDLGHTLSGPGARTVWGRAREITRVNGGTP